MILKFSVSLHNIINIINKHAKIITIIKVNILFDFTNDSLSPHYEKYRIYK